MERTLRSLRSDQETTAKAETKTTRELRSSDEKVTEQSDVCLSNGVNGSKLVTHQMETQCKQTVDDLIARYLAKKPLPGTKIFYILLPILYSSFFYAPFIHIFMGIDNFSSKAYM